MRSAAMFCACAVSLSAGCATGHRLTQVTPKQQWEALCRRMPQRRLPVVTDATCAPCLSPVQETVLRHVAIDAMKSVVSIKTATRGSSSVGNDYSGAREVSTHSGGTGVVISSDGLILTNEHVVRNMQAATVVFHEGAEYPVESIAVHPRLDLAVLRIDRQNLQPMLPSHELLMPGTPVVAVSYKSDDRQHNFRSGVVTDTQRSLQRELDPARRKAYGDLIETTAQFEPGFSGGPLLDSEGRLVGLNVAVTGRAGTEQLRGYALPFNDLNSKAVASLAEKASAKP